MSCTTHSKQYAMLCEFLHTSQSTHGVHRSSDQPNHQLGYHLLGRKPRARSKTKAHSCLKMGDLALDTDDEGIDIYHRLGLKKLHKGVLGKPKFLRLLSSLLEDSVKKNEMLQKMGEINDALTVFHGSRAPPVDIQHYIDRIFKYAGCSSSCFIVAYIYVDRYLQQTEGYLTSLNVHRLLITSLMVAAKVMDDSFFNNAYYAKVGGVSTSEMNRLEMKLLFALDFKLQVDVETFRRYCLQLEKEAGSSQVDQTIKVCWIKDNWSKQDSSPCDTPIAR